jgi:predicted transcriptional regulator
LNHDGLLLVAPCATIFVEEMRMTTTQGIKLDEETRDRLKTLGEKRDRSPHWLMRAAIESYLDHEEKYENEKAEDLQRWERYQLTGRAIDGEVVEDWLDDLANNRATSCPR